MPSILKGPRILSSGFVDADTVAHGRITSRNADLTSSTRVWIIVASVAGVLAFGACIALVAMSFSRRRLKKQLLQEARQRNPCLGNKEFSRKRRMTESIIEFEAESQREAIIRKSLASRSGHSISLNSHSTIDMMSVDDRPDSRSTQEYSWMDEGTIERNITRSRSGTGLSDKSWESGMPLRSSSPFPDLPARTFSRSSSPSRLVQGDLGRSDLPPLLEQHPLFRNMSGDLGPDTERE